MPTDQPFDLPTWRERVADWWRESAPDLRGAMRRLGVRTAYGTLAASAWLPLLAAYADDPGPAVAALAALTSGVGSNLLSNLVQGAYERATVAPRAERELAERPELRAEYEQALNGLGALEAARAALGEDWAAFEKRLRWELERMGGDLRIESGGGAVVLGTVTVRYGDFVGRDKHEHHHYHLPNYADTRKLRACYHAYLRQLTERHGRLPLRGVDVQAGDPTARTHRPRLSQVYVHLDTTTLVKDEHGERRKAPALEAALVDREGGEARRLGALEATLGNRRLVLLGAPGSGKSTFVGHLAFCLAMAQREPGAGWLEQLPGWPEAEAGALPVVIVLRDLARWATAQGLERGSARTLSDFVAAWLAEHDLGDFFGPLQRALRQGQALVLLDGLDEVRAELRALVRDAVQDFSHTYAEARLLITCRTLSYQDPAWQLEAARFSTFELAPFDEGQIEGFIEAWYRELADLGAARPEEVGTLAARLHQAVRRPDLWRLAPNPLLLTVMALVHAYRGRLPQARALLYEECTDMLLWRWEQQKLAAQREAVSGLRALLDKAGLQDVDLKAALWALAFEAHGAVGREDDAETTADIPEHRLLYALCDLHPTKSLDWAKGVVAQIKERAGLLVEREPGVYAFPHRTFQEYLAGCHLSVQADFPEQAAALAGEADFWRQVVLLAVGRQVHVSVALAGPRALVAELCPAGQPHDERGWRAAWLAGEVLLEMGVERAGRSQQGRDLLARVRARLAALLEGGHLAPRERAEAGDILGRLGDLRRGVGRLPDDETTPDFLWVEIPAGPFLMGSRKDDREAYDDEQPQRRLDIPYRYWVSRYPVTVAQYACFVEAGGYESPDWWTAAGWAWQQGARQNRPVAWGEQQENPNRPIMNVSWFEAVAYCRWLTGQVESGKWQVAEGGWGVWREGRIEPFVRPPSTVLRLPTEAEWEKAARGAEACRYPWGNEDWEPERANVNASGIGHPTPVGVYPRGATPSGLLDMAGNVWEWTASLYEPYPYRRDDGRNDPDSDRRRVLRGGSWFDVLRYARGAVRLSYVPVNWFGNVGFRVVVSLALASPDS